MKLKRIGRGTQADVGTLLIGDRDTVVVAKKDPGGRAMWIAFRAPTIHRQLMAFVGTRDVVIPPMDDLKATGTVLAKRYTRKRLLAALGA